MSDHIHIINAAVRTMSPDRPRAEAIAISGNRIQAVGSTADIQALGPATRTIDADGATVMPGFVEAHAHLFMGSQSLTELDLQWTQGVEALTKAIQGHAAARPDDDLLIGRSVNYAILGEGTRPTRQDLDKILPDRPLFLRSADYHNAWVNTTALQAAGVLHGHDVGPGSEIVLQDGVATGELREMEAMEFVANRITPPGREGIGLDPQDVSPEDRRADIALLKEGLAYCAAQGITTIQNMDGNFYQCALLRQIEEDGDLICRMEMPYHFLPSEPLENMARATRMAETYASDKLWSGRVKMFMDGVLDAWTAVMVEDYADRPGIRGEPLFTPDQFNTLATEADRRGLQVSVHAIGDGAVRHVLDGYAAAADTNGSRDSRHRIEHIEVIHPDDIPRMADLGVLASMQANHPPGGGCFPKEPTIHMIGPDRWPYSYAWRTLQDADAPVVFGTDWPVAPIDPLLALRQALTRPTWAPDLPDQRLTMEEALAAYTRVGAYTCFKEDQFGTLAPGMLADIVILDGPLPEDPASEVWPKVRMTLCDGQMTFGPDG
ncbi:MAG: amidohydrolase [Pseudomonadota bacterium]